MRIFSKRLRRISIGIRSGLLKRKGIPDIDVLKDLAELVAGLYHSE
jgi:hypothetical protein